MPSNSRFEELWEKYHDMFGSWFPTMCFPTDTIEETESKIKRCLKEGKSAEQVFGLQYKDDFYY